MNIAIIGGGYVGLTTGVCLAEKGHKVICLDKKKEVVDRINAGSPLIYEAGLNDLLSKTLRSGNFIATMDLHSALKGADVIFIAVGTPFDGMEIDLAFIKDSSAEIGRWLKNHSAYSVIVVKSTVVPTTTEKTVRPILEKESGKLAGRDFGLCSNPEFLREGTAVADFMNPDRIVIGSWDAKSGAVLKNIYEWSDALVVNTNIRTAEMIKYTSNSLLATLISFSNEMANLAATVGDIDIREVMQGLHLDARFNPIVDSKRVNPGMLTYLEAGCGFGGSCLPKDVKAITTFAKKSGIQMGLIEQVITINEKQVYEVIRLLKSVYPRLAGIKVAVLGLAFKPHTNDVRESSAITIIDELLKQKVDVMGFDPLVKEEFNANLSNGKLTYADSWKDALVGRDAVIVVTRWPEFYEITQESLRDLMRNPVLIDARRIYDRMKFKQIDYLGIGYRNNKDGGQ